MRAGGAPKSNRSAAMAYPHALLRAGFPYVRVLGMRRVTTFPVDVAVGDDRIYVAGRTELGVGGNIRMVSLDDEDLGTMADTGHTWPVSLLRDDEGNIWLCDEGAHNVTVYSAGGDQLAQWGEHGSAPGRMDRPSGMAFDGGGNLWIVDTMNHRVQQFSRDGDHLGGFGSHGSGPGELNMPWGIVFDAEGNLFVSDWRNHRVQRFAPDGELLMLFGKHGSGQGELSHPAGLAIDEHGDVYVADRDNSRVVMFDKTGRYVESFTGNATLGQMGRIYILANQKTLRLREMTSLEPQRLLRWPQAVTISGNRLYIPDFGSHRVQVYEKDALPLSESEILPELRAPTLMTT